MKRVLIVVDMQNGFLRNECTKKLADKIEMLLAARLFDVVIGTRFLNYSQSMFEKVLDYTAMLTEEDITIPSRLLQYMDCVEDKYIYNCVDAKFMTGLRRFNDGIMPEQVYFVGVDTECCVLASAVAMFENNVCPIVLIDYCASNAGKEAHDAGIVCLQNMIGKKQLINGDVVSVQDLGV